VAEPVNREIPLERLRVFLRSFKRHEIRIEEMRHKTLYEKAVFIDWFVDHYRRLKGRKKFPQKEVRQLIEWLFKKGTYLGRGDNKTVYRVTNKARDLVLKIGQKYYIDYDDKVYKRLPRKIRNRYFAKIYWRTKYALLQKYGKSARVSGKEMEKLKAIGKKYGMWDIRRANIRNIQGSSKIVDACLEFADPVKSRI
jgi:hypothetical protein